MPNRAHFRSGSLSLHVNFNDRTNRYKVLVCPLRESRARCETQYVGVPAFITRSVDSYTAMRNAAHAAISFSSNEVQERAEPKRGGIGWSVHLARRPRRAGR